MASVTASGTSRISIEMSILLSCARIQMAPQQRTHLQSWLNTDVDWEQLIRLGTQHGMLPLLYWHLQALSSETISECVSVGILGQLRDHFHGNSMRSFTLSAELLSILDLLDANNIPALPIKGVTLAASVYGNPALRQPGDLDILIRPDDALAVKGLLAQLGFYPNAPSQLNPSQEQAWMRYRPGRAFFNADKYIDLDLHWRLFPKWFSDTPDFDGLWQRRQNVSIRGGSAPTLGAADLLAYLCLHGGKHGWTCLKWLIDIAEFLRTAEHLDWVHVRQQTLGREPMLWVGLALAHKLLNAPLPKHVRRQIAAEPALRHFFAQAHDRLLCHNTAPGSLVVEGLANVFDHARMRSLRTILWQEHESELHINLLNLDPRLIDHQNGTTWTMAKSWLRLTLMPTPAEIQRVVLPAPLFSLYYMLRVVHLLRKVTIGAGLVIWRRMDARILAWWKNRVISQNS